ncbi:MAG: acyclic terpene utilization AtuA family protein [Paracoccaceae bacterium]|nr:acyclic terpene utilization AtuA family protein [Paracoccaceae bacterium]
MAQGCELIRIGGASGFWGDAAHASAQLLQGDAPDFIIHDYLAEITMAILARARARDPMLGYATDFVTAAMVPNLAAIAEKGVRIISNAGGVNAPACAQALRAEIARLGLSLKVATVTGDDLMDRIGEIAGEGVVEMFSGDALPPRDSIGSANVYLGAFPIAAALDAGADIVVAGRCTDSALALGACIHAFDWQADELDLLAGGSLAGHVIECGPQATGGNFTDWQQIADSLADIGYPIAEVARDGSFTITKPAGTGGLVSTATVAEQMLYEIGDPQAYVLPDVICDFSEVTLEQVGVDRVLVCGARGRGVPDSYKACLTWHDGWRGGQYFTFYGADAEAAARCFSESALTRARRVLRRAGAPDFTDVSVELLGAESQFGAARRLKPAREVVAKIAVRHASAEGVAALLREATGLGLSAPPGLCGFAGTRPRPSPVLALFSFLWPKGRVRVGVTIEDRAIAVAEPAIGPAMVPPEPLPTPARPRAARTSRVELKKLAWARSGDKGNAANIGVIARTPALLPWIWHGLNEAMLRESFGHFLAPGSPISRYPVPGIDAMNIVLHNALGGGGTSSLRNDPQGKGFAQLLLAQEIEVDASLLEELP